MAYPLKNKPVAATDEMTPGGIRSQLQAMTTAPYLNALNPEQRLAVETLDGPVLVLAGAGTGKTRVLTTRIAHILNTTRTRPHEVLAVTFTNKAAREMKARIGKLIGPSAEDMAWLGTFHSISAKILRRHAELVDLDSNFTILDTDDQIRLLKQILQATNVDEKRWPARHLAYLIDSWKNRALAPDKVPAADGVTFANGRAAAFYATYQARLKTLNAADFGDLLVECIRLFRQNNDVLETYQRRFKYILVDEYQDTNVAQYLWLRLLAQGTGNLACVGDDDQSIYGWRGAEVDNILRFEHDFAGAKVIRLERNYRSTGHILAAASHLISHNNARLGKALFTDDGKGEKVTLTPAWDSQSEARAIGEKIEDLQFKGHSLNEMAVLVRVSTQMREFEDRFLELGLSYRVIGGPRFYERMEIRDALAYLRATVQPRDGLAFERILNTPKRGLGEVTLRAIHALSRARDIPMMRAAQELVQTQKLRPQARKALTQLLESFARWRNMAEDLSRAEDFAQTEDLSQGEEPPQHKALPQGKEFSHARLAEIILDESGYTDMWKNAKSADAPGRLDNLKELIRSMEQYASLREFLEHVALVMEASTGTADDALSLMTLHAAKGLEFDTVFLPGWEEELFPHRRALDSDGQAGLEEERRLAYVGLTRAKSRAFVSFASSRQIHGKWLSAAPSRFLDELPADHVTINEAIGFHSYYSYGSATQSATQHFSGVDHDGYASPYATPGWRRAQNASPKTGPSGPSSPSGPLTIEGESTVRDTGPSSFSVGERVFHIKFGYGAIAAIDGNKLTIDFEKAGRKRVMDTYVERHA